ncbi:alpha-(1,3)-fucosyltransferase C-like [Penaeus chinensis]|uniref:alpha-(1,3)-fucosyltransferase C-like n=1 Tax=Penaeus chinensis TaxID=139456 RepID=UPI001FB7C616|nr:alpha-(1,3)-fucosyltransferase C-like [Penaeus chinensis]
MRYLRGFYTVQRGFAYLLVSTITISVIYIAYMTLTDLRNTQPSKDERNRERKATITRTNLRQEQSELLQEQAIEAGQNISENSQIPNNSQIPQTVKHPESVRIPENVQVPQSPDIPDNTKIPANSQIPENPNVPEIRNTLPPHPPPHPPHPAQTPQTRSIPAYSRFPLAPGDSHLPYEDENAPKFPKFPKELWAEPGGTPEEERPGYAGPPLKKILFWNDAYGNRHYGFGYGREPFIRAGCRINTCTTTANRAKYPLTKLDAVIWHFRSNDKSLPAERSPHTRYIFWMMESASYLFGDLNRYNNVFNWTFTYRLDSDIPNPYGRVYRLRQPHPPSDYNYAGNKTKLVAWVVSNCKTQSGREQVVQALKKWIKVDVYGRCGPLKCPRSTECTEMLNATYKFYLSFENSLCQDYATEKFFGTLKLNVIPVVYGLGNYSIQAPPHSYIDALSFPSVKKLAEYLLYLDSNDTAYNEYFRWKAYHHFPMNFAKFSRPFCEICERLHTDNKKSVYNLRHWFVTKSHCLSGSSPSIKAFVRGS